jgi:hypothetical protein
MYKGRLLPRELRFYGRFAVVKRGLTLATFWDTVFIAAVLAFIAESAISNILFMVSIYTLTPDFIKTFFKGKKFELFPPALS